VAAIFRLGHIISHSLVISALLASAQVCAFATGSVTLAWEPSTDPTVIGYNLYYGGESGAYTNTISTDSTTNTVVSGLVEGMTYYFAATAYDSSGMESPFSNEASYIFSTNAVSGDAANNPPTLDGLADFAVNQNAGVKTVNLTGIGSGATSETQTLTVTAVSSNPALIPAPTVSYASANNSGTLTFAPAYNVTGTATIAVTVNDGQAQNNMVTRTFTVTVNPANQPPTLNPIGSLYLTKNPGAQTVNLNGVTSGLILTNKKTKIKITVSSSNRALIRSVTVKYKSPASLGTLTFKPVKNAVGTTTITVSVNNGAKVNNLTSQTFSVTVLAPSIDTLVTAKTSLAATTSVTAMLEPVAHAAGEFALTLSGVSGQHYVIQASENLVDWVPVQTNTAPFTFTDAQANQFKQRFYRSVEVDAP
jgi:Fibronectin type III domain